MANTKVKTTMIDGSVSGGGAVNLITNGDAENATTSIFVPYADGAAYPVDGIGGSPTVTTSITATNPLTGDKSYLLSIPASAAVGNGFSIDVPLDLSYRGKSLKISFDYIFNTVHSLWTSSSMIWTCYDITNSKIVEPSNTKMFSNSTTVSDTFEATVQFDSNCTSFRLIANMAATFGSANEIKIDNVTVSPQNYVYGTPITDPVAYTPTLSNSTNATVDISTVSRNGDRARVKGFITWAGAGGGSSFTVSIPSGLSIDASKIKPAVQNTILGTAQWLDNGTARKGVNVVYSSATVVQFEEISSSAGVLVGTGFASGDTLSYDFEVPILGWSSSVQMSDSFEGRNITAEVNRSSAQGSQAITATTQKIIFGAKTKDSVNSFDTTLSRYTILSSGDYKFTPRLSFNTLGANGQADLLLYKNGAGYKTITSGFTTAGANHNLTTTFVAENCVAGDYFEIFISCSTTMQMLSAATILGGSQLSIEKIQGPQTIAANESINAVYTTAAGQSIPNATDTIIDFGTAEINSHGNVATGAAWKFTAQISGVYEVSAFVQLNSGGGWAVSEEAVVSIFKNGTGLATIGLYAETVVNSVAVSIPCTPRQVRLLAGEYVDIRLNQNSGAALTLVSSALRNWVSIKKVG